jgi:hypothetical protein
VTLPAGLLLLGGAGAGALLRGLGADPRRLDAAARRLACPLLGILALGALVLALLETLLQTGDPLSATALADVPYLLGTTLFGVLWVAHVGVLAALAWRLRAGRAPGLLGAGALLLCWPQFNHLAPNFDILTPDTLFEVATVGAHRVGAALWVGALAVLIGWSRPGGPAAQPWGGAFVRMALPAAALLLGGAVGLVATHGGGAALFGGLAFARLVQIKIALFGGLVALGALHFGRYRRRPGAPAPRTLLAEVAVGGAAVALGALLGLLPAPGS